MGDIGNGDIVHLPRKNSKKEECPHLCPHLFRQSTAPIELVVVKPDNDGGLEVIGRITPAEAP